MAFYIFPPKGTLSLAKLEFYARKRLDLLMRLSGCHGNPVAMQDVLLSSSTVESSDCLIEGSTKDAVSHFTLRLAFAADPEMASFFQQAESTLFFCRMSYMNREELKNALQPLKKYYATLDRTDTSSMNDHHKEMTAMLDHLTELMDWDMLVCCYIENTGHSVMLPWYHVPALVAQRVVVLHKGYAVIECGKLPDILRAIFDKMLSNGMVVARKKIAFMQNDNRMNDLAQKLKDIYHAKFNGAIQTKECVRHEHIDENSQYFPPCMKNLHKQLREKHRLGHHNRIAYTLFLKEVGLPVNEALQFWRQEYSQAANGGSPCKHSWDNDAKRYTYNIRHLYGLEGNRINYKSHRCQSIQNSDPSPLESGGCPFKHFDKENLTKLLQLESVSPGAMRSILTSATEGNWSIACRKLYEEKVGIHCGHLKCVNTDGKEKRESFSVQSKDIPTLQEQIKDNDRTPETKLETSAMGKKRLSDMCMESDNNDNGNTDMECFQCFTNCGASVVVKNPEQDCTSEIRDSGIHSQLLPIETSVETPVKRRKLNGTCRQTTDTCESTSGEKDVRASHKVCTISLDRKTSEQTAGSDLFKCETVCRSVSEEGSSAKDASKNIHFSKLFHKPINFFRSYRALVEGLSH